MNSWIRGVAAKPHSLAFAIDTAGEIQFRRCPLKEATLKEPSKIGAAIEQAIDRDSRYRRPRDLVQYACFYQTPGGNTFAVERVTLKQVRLWLPENEDARTTAEKEGLVVAKSVPYSEPSHPRRYGRLSSLKSVPELSNAVLYVTAVVSVNQALVILGALA